MRTERRWWGRFGWIVALVSLSALLMGVNLLAKRSPLKMGVLASLRPALALLGEIDPPELAPVDDPSGSPEIDALRARNARLNYEVHRLRDLLASSSRADFVKKRYPFRTLPAQVLCRAGVPGMRRAVLVDRGRVDGVRKGMGVITGDRVVGRVHRVGEAMSLVLLLTDPGCKVRATFLPEEGAEPASELAGEKTPAAPSLPPFEGLCEGDLDREGALRFRHLPRHADVPESAPVVTTGRAGIFPAGMWVGRVSAVEEEPGGLFLVVGVKPAGPSGPLRSITILLPVHPREWEADVRSRR
ncbi:MAG: rod shape-determining protein MreC [Planctomycetota bacterium]